LDEITGNSQNTGKFHVHSTLCHIQL
jgi:hypothetical protein